MSSVLHWIAGQSVMLIHATQTPSWHSPPVPHAVRSATWPTSQTWVAWLHVDVWHVVGAGQSASSMHATQFPSWQIPPVHTVSSATCPVSQTWVAWLHVTV
jgi:hypothetical protein